MKHLRRLIVAAVVVSFATSAFAANIPTKAEIADGWISLFDGETKFGWKTIGDAEWDIIDGAFVSEGGAKGALISTTEFADFILKVDFRLSLNGSSLIAFREDETGYGPMLPIGKVVAKRKPGLFKPGEWQTALITCKGEHVAATVDGTNVFNATLAQYRRGVVKLAADPTDHKVEFRNIFIKPLELKPIFNGKNLDGWNVLPGHKSVYSVNANGEMNVKNGNGDIQTAGAWADFCLQMDIISNGDKLNSGVFFRCIPGKFWAGYESQIRNEWKDNDRAKPVDFGTGGIYHRQAARKVVSTDNAWFTKTIVATGRHIAIWVDGYQTADWTDDREPNENPRKGYRAQAGAISLQGHDPTTDLSFKNINIVEYPKQPKPAPAAPAKPAKK